MSVPFHIANLRRQMSVKIGPHPSDVEPLIDAYEALDAAARGVLSQWMGDEPFTLYDAHFLEDALRANDGIEDEDEYVQVGWRSRESGEVFDVHTHADHGKAYVCCEPVYVRRGQ